MSRMTMRRTKDSRLFSSASASGWTSLWSASWAVIMLVSINAPSVQGQVFINVGAQTLAANSPTATLTFTIASGSSSSVSGLNFNIQVGDGTVGPPITGVELITGTPFGALASTQQPNGSQPAGNHAAFWNVTTPGSPPATITVGSGNKVATITFDTTGFNSGNWSLHLDATANGPTTYLDSNGDPITTTITDGTLTIVPEPSTYAAVAGMACLAFGIFVRRARR
jgi:hypothetical protein